MSGPLIYSPQLTWRQMLIASCDEIDLEERVLRYPFDADPWLAKYRAEEVAALREIDRLKIAGEYEKERSRLSDILADRPIWPSQVMEVVASLDLAPLNNFSMGLQSPDEGQRARFRAMVDMPEIGEATPGEIWSILRCIEPAKMHKGRPTVSPPWRNVASHLDAMRLDVARGASIPFAARDAASREGGAGQHSRAKYFERLFRDRQKIRH
jgi:hypothetical protein